MTEETKHGEDMTTPEGRQRVIIRQLTRITHLCIGVIIMFVVVAFVLLGTWNAILTNRTRIEDFTQQHIDNERVLCVDIAAHGAIPPPEECAKLPPK